ncbi:hypothetical protein HCH_07041 [Hahella chejuensis KCTC 2396]|uniref:Uncharacterized protein n=1 Tax=Hahella chejuensis (strain KCTC 2396) TaxID=349521 RepID=Q2S6R8_HAHCH|nr:hypothetical protein HCH_07041 [Hahella chejuensis KCTC 2396]
MRSAAKASKVDLLTYSDLEKLLKKHPIGLRVVMALLSKSRLAI